MPRVGAERPPKQRQNYLENGRKNASATPKQMSVNHPLPCVPCSTNSSRMLRSHRHVLCPEAVLRTQKNRQAFTSQMTASTVWEAWVGEHSGSVGYAATGKLISALIPTLSVPAVPAKIFASSSLQIHLVRPGIVGNSAFFTCPFGPWRRILGCILRNLGKLELFLKLYCGSQVQRQNSVQSQKLEAQSAQCVSRV